MPYKDPEKNREAARRSYLRRKAEGSLKKRVRTESDREYHARYYLENKDKWNFHGSDSYKENASLRENKRLSLIRSMKSKETCGHCGDCDADCLQFHHVDPTTKLFEINRGGCSLKNRSIESIMSEIAKCIVLCANCHTRLEREDDPPLTEEGIAHMRKQHRRRARHLRRLRSIRSESPCAHCGITDPACLQYHHLDPTIKSFGLGGKTEMYRSWKSIEEEISKCIVLCANCHLREGARLRVLSRTRAESE